MAPVYPLHGGNARHTHPAIGLVAYDADEAGEAAAGYWVEVLDNARRWRPYWEDVNAMAQDGADVRAWVAVGVDQ